jgi:hypothetical protein
VWQGSTGFFVYANSRTEHAISFAGRPIVQSEFDEDVEERAAADETLRNVQVFFDAPALDQAQPAVTVTAQNNLSINNGKDMLSTIQIPDASPIIPLTGVAEGFGQGAVGFTIPETFGQRLNINYTPAQANATNVLGLNSNQRFSVRAEWTAESSERAQQAIVDFPQDSFAMTSAARVPSFNIALAKLDETLVEFENVVRLRNATLEAGDSLAVRLVNDGENVVVSRVAANPNAPAMRFDLNLSRGVGQTVRSLSIGARETQIYAVENWNAIDRSGLTMLADTNSDGKIDMSRTLRDNVATSVSSTNAATPNELGLRVYPNPVVAQATIELTLAARGVVTIELTNVLGQTVAVLHNALQEQGKHALHIDLSAIAPGMYFYRIQTPTVQVLRPVQIVR